MPETDSTPPFPLRIREMALKKGQLLLELESFPAHHGESRFSSVDLRIKVWDPSGHSLFDQAKTITPRQGTVRIRIALPHLAAGEYLFAAEAGRPGSRRVRTTLLRGEMR